jgi:hypothetical protein
VGTAAAPACTKLLSLLSSASNVSEYDVATASISSDMLSSFCAGATAGCLDGEFKGATLLGDECARLACICCRCGENCDESTTTSRCVGVPLSLLSDCGLAGLRGLLRLDAVGIESSAIVVVTWTACDKLTLLLPRGEAAGDRDCGAKGIVALRVGVLLACTAARNRALPSSDS